MARFADYCAYSRPYPEGVRDPVSWLWGKLQEIEEPTYVLKQQTLDSHCQHFLKKAAHSPKPEAVTEFRALLEGYVTGGDFAVASFHLMSPAELKDPGRLKMLTQCLNGLKVARLLDEENQPEERQGAFYKHLVVGIYKRLRFDQLDTVRRRKPLTLRRLRMLLRRCRFETANYAAVFHFPMNPEDTFTPFILPRVEALVAANRRFLRTLRTR